MDTRKWFLFFLYSRKLLRQFLEFYTPSRPHQSHCNKTTNALDKVKSNQVAIQRYLDKKITLDDIPLGTLQPCSSSIVALEIKDDARHIDRDFPLYFIIAKIERKQNSSSKYPLPSDSMTTVESYNVRNRVNHPETSSNFAQPSRILVWYYWIILWAVSPLPHLFSTRLSR